MGVDLSSSSVLFCWLCWITSSLVVNVVVDGKFSRADAERFFLAQDAEREEFLSSEANKNNFNVLRDRFYKMVSAPEDGACQSIKAIGGVWDPPPCHSLDGQKDVCAGPLLEDVAAGRCLVYSFGVGDDWTFEDAVAALGCRVRAFDPTIDAPERRSANVSFHKLGLSWIEGDFVLLMTLHGIRSLFGESDATISYLKVDVEGYEVRSLPEWVRDEAASLKRVHQIGVEFHLLPEEYGNRASTYASLLRAFGDMRRRLGYALASYSPNQCQERGRETDGRYHSFFDLLFVKQSRE